LVSAETKPSTAKPANWAPFRGCQEISPFARMRGGGCRPHRTRLSLHFWEMQGDFRKMQGGGHRTPAKSHQISTAWGTVSLLNRAGKSRESHLCLAGWWIYARRVECGFFRASRCAQTLGIVRSNPVWLWTSSVFHSRNVSWIL